MSRLDSVIRRLKAQRACLNHAADRIADRPGVVVELGLGNGRTYDHLREILPGREIFVFDRQVDAHPDCVPDPEHLILGDVLETVPAAGHLAGRVVLVHADVGTGDAARNARLMADLAGPLDGLLAPGAVVVSDQNLDAAGWPPLPLPEGVAAGRYHLYRKG